MKESKMRKYLIFLSVLTIVFFANSAFAVIGIGARAGMNMFEDDPPGDGIMFGGQLRLDIPMTPFSAEIATEYFSTTEDKEIEGVGEYEAKFHDIAILATAKYKTNLLPLSPIKPYAGVGIGMHIFAWEFTYEGESVFMPEDQDESKFGWHGVVGADIEFPMMPVKLFVETKYTSIQTEGDPTNYTSVYGGVNFGF